LSCACSTRLSRLPDAWRSRRRTGREAQRQFPAWRSDERSHQRVALHQRACPSLAERRLIVGVLLVGGQQFGLRQYPLSSSLCNQSKSGFSTDCLLPYFLSKSLNASTISRCNRGSLRYFRTSVPMPSRHLIGVGRGLRRRIGRLVGLRGNRWIRPPSRKDLNGFGGFQREFVKIGRRQSVRFCERRPVIDRRVGRRG
jgi:hypothetical protein